MSLADRSDIIDFPRNSVRRLRVCWTGRSVGGMRRVGEHIENYLSALRSHHVDNYWLVAAFEDLRLRCILRGAYRMYPHTVRKSVPMTRHFWPA